MESVNINNLFRVLSLVVMLPPRYVLGYPQSPCPNIFQYEYDGGLGDIYGLIQTPVDSNINVIRLDVRLSVGNQVQGFSGNIELVNSKSRVNSDIQNGRPLQYRVYFPRWVDNAPRITQISVNGDQICYGYPIDRNTASVITTVHLQHTLTLNVSPWGGSGQLGHNNRFGWDSTHNFDPDDRVDETPQAENTQTRPIVFNPQMPKDPSKVFSLNPFLNSHNSWFSNGNGAGRGNGKNGVFAVGNAGGVFGVGSVNGGSGNSNGGLGNPNGGFGNSNGAFGNSNGAFGNTNSASGIPNGASGLPNGGFGLPNAASDPSNEASGLPNADPGLPNGASGLPNGFFGISNSNPASGTPNLSPTSNPHSGNFGTSNSAHNPPLWTSANQNHPTSSTPTDNQNLAQNPKNTNTAVFTSRPFFLNRGIPTSTTTRAPTSAPKNFDAEDLPTVESNLVKNPSKNLGNCGTSNAPNALLIRGNDLPDGIHPWLAAIFMQNKEGGLIFICGSSLISNKHIVTAAHCVQRKRRKLNPDELWIVLGRQNIQRWAGDNAQIVQAEETHLHPDHQPHTADADIALVVLAEQVRFTSSIKPVCLWAGDSDQNLIVEKTGTVVGWGKDESGKVSPEPKQITFPVVSEDTCLRSNPGFVKITSNRTFCAGFRNNSGPCNGDSGGGFLMLINGRWYLRGVVSMSLLGADGNCDLTQYVVFTDVAKYLSWILSII